MSKKPGNPESRSFIRETEKGLASQKLIVLTLESKMGGTGNFSYRFNKNRIVIGSVASADVRLTGKGISPIHAVLAEEGDVASIYDLASESGISVNGQKTVTRALKNGDKLAIGGHQLTFFISDVEAAPMLEKIDLSEGRKLFFNPLEDLRPMVFEDDRPVFEIFDYRPTSKQALEVVMSWKETILAVEHFVEQKEVTIGHARKSHFGIPPLLSSSRFTIVSQSSMGFTLNLDAQMKGVIHKDGELRSFDQIRSVAPKGPTGVQVPFEQDDFAKVSIGDIDFYLSFTAAPPRLKMSKLFERDPLFFKALVSSMLFTTATITALLSARVPQNLEAEQIPERIATILYQPEKYSFQPKIENKESPVPVKPAPIENKQAPKPEATQHVKIDVTPNPKNTKPVPKEMVVGEQPKTAKASQQKNKGGGPGKKQEQAKKGQGSRAQGKEGKRGSSKAGANKVAQSKASRPSPEGGTGRGSGNSQVKDEGNVDFLQGASGKIQDILGNSAAKLGKGGEKLRGFGGFDTQGGGGLALSGTGKGGGGDATTNLGGLSNRGRGGGKVGTGRGAVGSGNDIIGGQTRVAIRTGGPEETVIMGAIDKDAVDAAIRAHHDEFRLCYEKEINAEHPTLAGRVATDFIIGSSGRVSKAGIAQSTLKNANAERCILDVLKRIDFPIPRGAGTVEVRYPFKFGSGGKS